MKNLGVYGFVFVGLMMSSMTSAIMSPKRIWQCVTQPDKNNCSADERKTAQNWIITSSVTAFLAFVTLMGSLNSGPLIDQRIRYLKNTKLWRAQNRDEVNQVQHEIQHLEHVKKDVLGIN